MRTSEILQAAKARLTPKTWLQSDVPGAEIRVVGKVCANQAIVAAIGLQEDSDDPRWRKVFEPVAQLLAQVATGHRDSSCVPPWNDAPERTLPDVLAAFDAAIAIAQQQECGSAETTGVTDQPVDVRATTDVGDAPCLSIRGSSSS
jgi:hypothetical protein